MTKLTFITYNYISALILTLIMIFFNIGYWPFTEHLFQKSYLPSNKALKYITGSTILLGQLLVFLFIIYILVTQHKKIGLQDLIKQGYAFTTYNYLSSSILIMIIILFNIGVWPFTEHLFEKSYLPSNKALKYITGSTILLGEIFVCIFIFNILIKQHKKLDLILTDN